MKQRRIGFVGFPRLTILDLVGPHEVFATANLLSRGSGRLYETVIVASQRTPFVSDSGITLTPQETFATASPYDTLITPGGPGLREPETQIEIADWLRLMSTSTRRMVSVCTGLYGLAASGLIDGRRAATHWAHAEDVARQFPKVTIDSNVLYFADPPFYTSAGITAGIDLALSLIADDHGSALALAVARELVVYLKRSGGQTQFSEPLRFQTRATDRLSDLTVWLPEHLADNLTLEVLSKRYCASPRNFARVFKKAFGATVGEYVETLRLDTARERLGTPGQSFERIAISVGYRNLNVFRRAFERKFGLTPSQYIRQFGRGP